MRIKSVRKLPLVVALTVGLAGGFAVSNVGGDSGSVSLAAPSASRLIEPSSAGFGSLSEEGTAVSSADGTFGRIPDVVERVQPAVVSVLVQTAQGRAEGSGVVWDGKKGLVVTNNHVVQDALEVEIVLLDGERVEARVRATDPVSDLAVLEVERGDLPTAEFARELPRVGELAIALGNPLGFENSVTAGIVSGLHRALPAGGMLPLFDLLQTDAPISPGNSGGALVDREGKVIGINVAAIPPTPDTRAVSIGFAIPSATAVIAIVEQLLDNGEARHARLGIQPANLTPEVAEDFGIQGDDVGVVVVSLVSGGAAERAGLHAGDLITGIDGVPVRIVEDLFSALNRYQPGDKVTLTFSRDGAPSEQQIVLADETGS